MAAEYTGCAEPTRRTVRRAGAVFLTTIAAVGLTLAATTGPALAASSDRSFVGCPILTEGSKNSDCVKRLQTDLDVVRPEYRLDTEGDFGPATRVAVLDFQGRNRLDADGQVGAITADVLAKQAESVETPNLAPAPGPSDSRNPNTSVESPLAPFPPEERVSKPGPHLCEWNAITNLPQPVHAEGLPPRRIVNSDGSETAQGVATVYIANGGCGLKLEARLQTKVCGHFGCGVSFHWATVASKPYETLDLPTYGHVTTPTLSAPLRKGTNSYRVQVEVQSQRPVAEEGPGGAKFGMIGFEQQGNVFNGPAEKLTY